MRCIKVWRKGRPRAYGEVMRPERLNPLFVAADSLKGVGTGLARPLERLGLSRVRDFAYHLPDRFVTRRAVSDLDAASVGENVVVPLTPVEYRSSQGRGPFRVLAADSAGNICSVTYFGRNTGWAKKALPLGEKRWIAGRLDQYGQMLQIVHPDHVAEESAAALGQLVEPVYPLSEGLTQGRLAGLIHQALERVPELPEWIEPGLADRMQWPRWRNALELAHKGEHAAARDRLAYDELLANSLALLLVKNANRARVGTPLVGDGSLRGKLSLPFGLTGAQARSVREIEEDMAQAAPMLRLLQGDVGSGKTVVALLAMARAAEAGAQAALMAPTEILARQHFSTIAPLAERAGLTVAILTGREKGRERQAVLNGLADGSIHIAVGTHALFQDSVAFRDLALAVVDEQHRFGVHQRLAISAKGDAPDLLVMTATPIPRTLVLTAFGDMEVSRLTEKPAGRRPIRTVTLPMERLGELVGRIRDAVAGGQKIYWICPLVEETEESDLTSAEERAETLRQVFGPQVGLVHGRMKGAEKDAAMRAFKAGQTRVLVATTVIEVGVDVPDATIIVIEHAERFGLAQLHQLRGRVGRGDKPSSCVLLYKEPLGETGKRRLSVMRETEDGFLIAEEDLKLRGEGEVLGTRQSGTPGFQLARMEFHADMLEVVRDDARLLLARDPDLISPRGEAVRMLLYLFGRDEAVRLLRAG